MAADERPTARKKSSAEAGLSRSDVALLLADVSRWDLLRELAYGDSQVITHLARRIGRSPNATGKQMQLMEKLGVLRRYNRVYQLVERYRPNPETQEIDFGYCVLRLTR